LYACSVFFNKLNNNNNNNNNNNISHVVVVLVVTAATIRSTFCFAVHLRVLARYLLVSLMLCVPQVENDGVTLVPWKRGRCLAWDATCPDTYAQSAIHESSVQAGSAAVKAELNKSRKYVDIIAGVDFIPFAIETLGVWGLQALELVSQIGRRLTSTTHEPRSMNLSSPTYLGGCDAWKRQMRSGYTPVIQLFRCLITMILTI